MGAGINGNVSYSISENNTWQMVSLGISASVGPQIGIGVNGGCHLGTTIMATTEIPTKERSWVDILFNIITH